MKPFAILTILLIILLYHGSANAQGGCQGDNIKVFKGASGCGCKCLKECVTPDELPIYLANGWNTEGCFNCCKFKNWVEASMPKTKIEAIHPNEEPGTFTIAFTLASKGDVRIRVTDLAGRHVITVLDQFREEADNELIWDNSLLTPGIYFLTLETGTEKETTMLSVTD